MQKSVTTHPVHGQDAKSKMYIMLITPEVAARLLEFNKDNRPIRDSHVRRLARIMEAGRWRLNGRTIIIAKSRDVLDGQHRLWAVVESGVSIYSYVVEGVDSEVFDTIDTAQQTRTFGDTVARGPERQLRHRNHIGQALSWLLRWQTGITQYKEATHRVENTDITAMLKDHPNMVRAVERSMKLRSLITPSLVAFVYYMLSNRNEVLAERLMATLDDPSEAGITDPFFKLRMYLVNAKQQKRGRDPLTVLAVTIKAVNAAHRGDKIKGTLLWRSQGNQAEAFPKLAI